MHEKNIHKNTSYNFKELEKVNPDLKEFTYTNDYNNSTIDFNNPIAVIALNKALLIYFYNLKNWELPKGYLCPPVPSRVDYIHHIADLLSSQKKKVHGLDIGIGANAIYSILGTQVYGWKMTGSDINEDSLHIAKKNINFTPILSDKITIKHQTNNANIFEGIINENDFFDFSICNPPFHNSKEEATKGSFRKLNNLNKESFTLNFGGQASELWCNGGEALFIKRMIKQSVLFKNQVGVFTSLVSKKENLPKIEKQLKKLNTNYKSIPMEHGNKKTRIVAWSFINKL